MVTIGDFKDVLGKGLAVVDGETHRRQRKMMNPVFNHSNIKVCTVYCNKYKLKYCK